MFKILGQNKREEKNVKKFRKLIKNFYILIRDESYPMPDSDQLYINFKF